MWNRRVEFEIFGTIGNVAFHSVPFFAHKLTQFPAFAETEREHLPRKWAWLDREMADGRPFLAGESFSIVDITGSVAAWVGASSGWMSRPNLTTSSAGSSGCSAARAGRRQRPYRSGSDVGSAWRRSAICEIRPAHHASLDGYIEGPNRELDWHFSDDEFEEYINDVLRSIDGMFFGRVAYELLAGYWPGAETNPTEAANKSDPRRHVEAARMMNTLPKYAVSNTLRGTAWNNSHIISGNIAAEIKKLKAQPGKDLALFAGAGLATSARRLGLID